MTNMDPNQITSREPAPEQMGPEPSMATPWDVNEKEYARWKRFMMQGASSLTLMFLVLYAWDWFAFGLLNDGWPQFLAGATSVLVSIASYIGVGAYSSDWDSEIPMNHLALALSASVILMLAAAVIVPEAIPGLVLGAFVGLVFGTLFGLVRWASGPLR
ncbi:MULTISPECIES: hypothetical protein [unclassified Thioalkalivibrio]|uniref:hypothetical protein n=1 Tax=unclassified Thioalkalivibrio TaxID=2621013 RepID=UPI0003607044|nr:MULTISPECIES: hypothetical protein [unclassified Thioalkalivibrio]